MKTRVILGIILFGISLFFNSVITYAERQIVEATGSYCIANTNTELASTAHQKAKASAIKSASEAAGYYIESYSKTTNFLLTDEELKLVTGNVLKIIAEENTQENLSDGNIIYKCKIKAEVDTDDIDFKKLKEHRKTNKNSIADYYKKDLVKIYSFDNGVTATIKTNSIHYDSNGYICFTMVGLSKDNPDIMILEWVIDNVKKEGFIKLYKFYDSNTGEPIVFAEEPPAPVKIGEWFKFDEESLAQYALNYIKAEEKKLNEAFLSTHFSSEKSFLYNLANHHIDTKNNLILFQHLLSQKSDTEYDLSVEAIIPDSVINKNKNTVAFKSITMLYEINNNPVIEIGKFHLKGLNHYAIREWEINKTKKTATRISDTVYSPEHKLVLQEKTPFVLDIPDQVSPNSPMIFNALCEFYQKYIK